MENHDIEGRTWRIVIIALTIAVLSVLAFTMPTPPAEAPTDVDFLEIPARAEAAEIEKVETEPELREALVPVCSCEATGSPDNDPVPHHYEDDGITLLTGRVNPADKGMCQINMDAHGETLAQMGLDIRDWGDYIEYTNHLFDTQGLEPWKYSKHCWSITKN